MGAPGFRGMGPARVDGDLAMSRSLGDFRFKQNKDLPEGRQKVIAVPDIYEYNCHRGDFLVLACDGAFDVFSTAEVSRLVRSTLQTERDSGPTEAASAVVSESLRRRSMDNVT